MFPPRSVKTAPFSAAFFPQQVMLVAIGNNVLPMGYWTVISKDPFRFLICMGVGNYSLGLLKKHKEAALHFMPWSEREKVVAAGYMSGRDVDKIHKLGFTRIPAEILKQTYLIQGADVIFETIVNSELMNLSREFCPFVLDVVAVHGNLNPEIRQPIFYLSQENFAEIGNRWTYQKEQP
jgi:flavin reductase (DIM6/NTAB) family NADH-FMN oxidoreductase RutF